jgi:hypothetical protein
MSDLNHPAIHAGRPRPLLGPLPSTYLHRDLFEFAVEDDGRDKEGEDDVFTRMSLTTGSLKSLRHKGIKCVRPRYHWLPGQMWRHAAYGYAPQWPVAVHEWTDRLNINKVYDNRTGRSIGRGFRIVVMESSSSSQLSTASIGGGNGKIPWSFNGVYHSVPVV